MYRSGTIKEDTKRLKNTSLGRSRLGGDHSLANPPSRTLLLQSEVTLH